MSVMNGDISEVVFEIFKGFQLNYTDTTVSFPKLLTMFSKMKMRARIIYKFMHQNEKLTSKT